MSDFSADSVAKQLDYCTFCPKMCRHACPVSTASGRETYIPQVEDGSPEPAAARPRRVDGGVDRSAVGVHRVPPLHVYCDHGNEPGLVLLTGRAVAVDKGVPHPALAGY